MVFYEYKYCKLRKENEELKNEIKDTINRKESLEKILKYYE
jgi:hypothetical protein